MSVVVDRPETTATAARPSAEPRPPVPAGLRIALAVSLVFTILTVFFSAYALGLSALQEQRSQHQLYAKLRGLLSSASPLAPPVGGLIKPGTPVALVDAPAAGITREVVVEGTSPGDLLAGPGHLRDSVLPGQFGQSVLVGRSVTAGAPFRDIDHLALGDSVTVTTAQGTFHFSVIDHRGPDDRPPTVPAGGALLTLVSASGSGWLAALAPGGLLYVDAKLVDGSPVDAPSGRPIAVPIDEQPGNSDPAVWPYLVLWLQALLVVSVAGVWAASRWGRRQTWLVGVPVVLAVMFGVAEAAIRLVPNVV